MYEPSSIATPGSESSGDINVEDYGYLVKRIAHHIIARMPANVQLDDLIQAGMVGLIEAVQKYNGELGASFETYAGIRIRGAIVDEMRRGDWVPRSVHRNARKINEAMSRLEAKSGREPSDAEIADELGVPLDEYHTMARDSLSGRLFSYDEAIDDEENNLNLDSASQTMLEPDKSVQRSAMRTALAEAITTLSEREQLVLSLYYEQELNLKEVGQVLGVSEGRVSQILSKAALNLRKKLADWRQN